MDLVTVLRQFNRKERYWLLRNALGKGSESLCDDFRRALSTVVGIEVPDDAWWAMDYHLDWLIGVLHLLEGGAENAAQKNDALVTGTQEDIDLVVAFANTLILIEAKAETSWSNKQLNSKVKRLEQIIDKNNLPAGLTIRFVLMSPSQPSQRLERVGGLQWQKWMRDGVGQPLHLTLRMAFGDDIADFRKIVRCDEEGNSNRLGTCWAIQGADASSRPRS